MHIFNAVGRSSFAVIREMFSKHRTQIKDLYCYLFLVIIIINLCATPTPAIMVRNDRVQYREKESLNISPSRVPDLTLGAKYT